MIHFGRIQSQMSNSITDLKLKRCLDNHKYRCQCVCLCNCLGNRLFAGYSQLLITQTDMSKCWRLRRLEFLKKKNIQNKECFFESAELVALGRKMKMDWPELRSKAEALASSPPLATTNRFTSIIKTNKNLGSTRWYSHCSYDNLAL